ncbi:filament-like plant protein 7 [Olea europaea var. sylvestris]|uniref:filament-like plant protein 7 n=1 Tax=Olea europaea var. sylvestris TaxID=158386 RepID=UPI000C1D0B26|nr:filament-like plant protein 7 [Olea europaea var. sylvestris]
MDNKSGLWKKKSSEKTSVADKANISLSLNEEELTRAETLLTEKANLERDITILNSQLSSAPTKCNGKDDFAKKQVKIAREAIAGWENAETEAISLKQELDNVLQQKEAAEERLCHLDAALKECMRHLHFVREEQEKRIQDAVMKMSKEFEISKITLDEKLVEASKTLAKLDAENTQLRKSLLGKDKLIEDLNKCRTQIEANFNALISRIESMKKENASLKYEVRVLEKEFDIRNEEREFNRRTSDVAQRLHLEGVKKIAKLESECQRLRLLVQKRLPGPAALAKMKDEVAIVGTDQVEMRGRKSYPSLVGSMDFSVDVTADAQSRIDFLTEQLHAVEEENRTLKETHKKKPKKLEFSRTMHARTASRLSQASTSDMGSDDKASFPEPWASALISDLEHFKTRKQLDTSSCKIIGTSEMELMDDFAEMEKLAVVSVDYPTGSSYHSSDEGNGISRTSGLVSRQEFQSDNRVVNKEPGWLGDTLKLLLEQSSATQRSPGEVLEDIRDVLAHNTSNPRSLHAKETTYMNDASPSPELSGHVYQKLVNNSLSTDASVRGTSYNISTAKMSSQKFQSSVSISVCKLLELIEGISMPCLENSTAESYSGKDDKLLQYKNSEFTTGYIVRVFQWKISELSSIIQEFICTCKDLLNGTASLEQFAQQVASTLEWIMNHCFSLQDVSSMKEAIRNRIDWDGSQSDSELDSELINHCAQSNKLHLESNEMPYIPSEYSLNDHNRACQLKEVQQDRRLSVELKNEESSTADLELRPQSDVVKSESFVVQIQESSGILGTLQSEMETMKQSKGKFEDQMGKHKLKVDPETQLMEGSLELNKEISCLENELEKRNDSCKRLDATFHDRQIQLKGMTSKEVSDDGEHRGKQLKNDWEVAGASQIWVECQETAQNLDKEVKDLASPTEATLYDKVMLTSKRNISQSSSLLDKMLAEDNVKICELSFSSNKEHIQNGVGDSAISTDVAIESRVTNSSRIDHKQDRTTAISPCKIKDCRGLLKKLLWRQKKSSSMKIPAR